MDDLQAAQEALIAKRLEMGLQEDGSRPQTTRPVVEVLKTVMAGQAKDPELHGLTTTLFRNKEAFARNCPDCGRHLEPIEWGHQIGQTLYAPRNCPECYPRQQQEREERQALEDQDRRFERYRGAFPVGELGKKLAGATFDNFDNRDGTQKALAIAKQYAEQLPRPDPSGLLVWGPAGNGKSHLEAAIANAARSLKMGVAWIYTPDWLRYIGTLESGDREARIALASEADLLILDDLGAERLTPARAEWLLSILDAVYRHRRNLVVTTNHSPEGLVQALAPAPPNGPREDYRNNDRRNDTIEFMAGTRIVDRLAEMSVFVHNGAPSYRMEMARRRLQAAGGEGTTS